MHRELEEVKFYDAGDIPLPFGNPQNSIDMIEDYVGKILDAGKFPLGIGGEHLVSWPVFKALHKKYDDFAIIHIDAHATCVKNTKANRSPIRHRSVKRVS